MVSPTMRFLWEKRFWRDLTEYQIFYVLFIGSMMTVFAGLMFWGIKADSNFQQRLKTAYSAHHYKIGDRVWCDVFPHDDQQTRLWTPCTIVTEADSYQYQVTYKDPHDGALVTDLENPLDMKVQP